MLGVTSRNLHASGDLGRLIIKKRGGVSEYNFSGAGLSEAYTKQLNANTPLPPAGTT